MTRFVIHNHLPRRARDAGRAVPREEEERNREVAYRQTGISRDAPKPELSEYLTKAFGSNWHQKGQTFPKPKQGSKEVSKQEYDKVVEQWRKEYASR
jgi:hypothetical protein